MRKCEYDWYAEKISEMETAAEVDQNLFWKLIKNKRQNKQSKSYEMRFDTVLCHTSDEIANGWSSYFEKLYSELDDEKFDPLHKSYIEQKFKEMKEKPLVINKELDMKVSYEEIVKAIRTLKNGKAGGDDGLSNEHLIFGGIVLHEHLRHLFSCMLESTAVPDNMKSGITITLLKAGKKHKEDPDSYRGITLLQVIYKLFEKTMINRIKSFVNSKGKHFPDRLQYAYQDGMSCVNCTFGVYETITHNTERGAKVFVCLLDSRKAFDVVWHCGLFVHLYELGINGKLWRTIINAYTNMRNCVHYKGTKSKHFMVRQSTWQGSIWGSYFFLVMINPLIKEL